MIGRHARHAKLLLGIFLAVAAGIGLYFNANPKTRGVLRRYESAVLRLTQVAKLAQLEGRVLSQPLWLPRRQLRAPVAEEAIGLWDMLGLQGCSLSVLVGERNSQLGRVQSPSQRLIYEVQLISELPVCVQALAEPTHEDGTTLTLAERLTKILANKRDQLPRVRWNAVWTGDEMGNMLRAREAEVNGQTIAAAAKAISALADLLATDDPHHISDRLEQRLDMVHRARSAGAVFGLAQEAIASLNAVTFGLLRYVEENAAGISTIPRCNVQMAQGIFGGRYVHEVQPALVVIERSASHLGGALLRLWKVTRHDSVPASDALGVVARAVWDPETGVATALRKASLAHAQAWQAYANACGMDLATLMANNG